jgi:hypothetical protein
MGGSITGEAPEEKAASSQVYSAAFSSLRRTIAQVPSSSVGDDREFAGIQPGF